MIVIILGGTGSGKTLSTVKEIIEAARYDSFPITNFELKKTKHHRLKHKDLLNFDDKKRPVSVNWKFWDNIQDKHKHFSIYLDEAHKIINARASMSKRNVFMSDWCSEVRKILGDNPNDHLYIISQTWRKIDVNFRELCHMVIKCSKLVIGEHIEVIQRYYEGETFNPMRPDLMRFIRPTKKHFKGNDYFSFYDHKKRQRFSDGDEYA